MHRGADGFSRGVFHDAPATTYLAYLAYLATLANTFHLVDSANRWPGPNAGPTHRSRRLLQTN